MIFSGSGATPETQNRPRLLSLCSGYGGFDRAVEDVFDADVVAHAETDPAASKVLKARWPGVPNLGDITTTDWTGVHAVILAAGYSCQPDSLIGKGLSEDDERWIWPDVARAIGCVGPRLVVLENVYGHFVRGFRTVLGSLADLGYDAQWTTLRASTVGAPHRRERLFVLAWPADTEGPGRWDSLGATGGRAETQGQGCRGRAGRGGARAAAVAAHVGRARSGASRDGRDGPTDVGVSVADPDVAGPQRTEPAAGRHLPTWRAATDAESDGRDGGRAEPAGQLGGPDAAERGAATVADADGAGLEGFRGFDTIGRDADRRGSADTAWGAYEPAIRRWERILGRLAPAPTEANTKGGRRLSPVFVEWMQGLPAGWVTDVPGISRNDQLRLLGNGVVVQQAVAALRLLLNAEAVAA
jgi:DNA (cytosine-5)-methyltransferase 1